ncbi:galactose mutarotase [Vibrio sp. DW001]|uniref:aldose epimerase family protein n=1 Tax=Vibrio sp. DW001 TaxID=2912315 RepID=UPI0023B115B0|nr:aldose epimerase family protein [Vibrio sp. DW001]WED28753.1 galactose mutarotase [Vibrio sp. DW001]
MQINSSKHGVFFNQDVSLFTLENDNGMQVSISQLGGIITSLYVPDVKGEAIDVVAGFDNFKNYIDNPHYIGALIGRVANRIEGASYTINDTVQHVFGNAYDGRHCVHGGYLGYNRRVWSVLSTDITKETVSLNLQLIDSDGEQGFKGNVLVDVRYCLNNDNQLTLTFSAVPDTATPLSFTGHSYFNLFGYKNETIADHHVQVFSSHILEQKEDRIPSGKIVDISMTEYDFSTPTSLTKSIEQLQSEINHSYVFNNPNRELIKMAQVQANNRMLTIYSNEKILHFYNGHNLDGVKGKNGLNYARYAGLCLEPKGYVNSINTPQFPSSIFQAEQTYNHTIKYDFGYHANDTY